MLTIREMQVGRRRWFVDDSTCDLGREECLCAWFDTEEEAKFYIEAHT